MDWDVEDIHVSGSPDWKFWDDWERADFEPATLRVVDEFVTPESTFVDIGAWTGPVSLWAARLGARVVAVEPDPAAIIVLHKNTAANYPAIEIFEGALNDYSGSCHIEPHVDGWGSSMTHLSPEGHEVPCLTMSDLFAHYEIQNCTLVKMDIEGAESVVLEHTAPFLAKLGIPLLVAMHQPWWSRPVESAWFDGYSEITGRIGDWNQVLAIP